MSDSDDSFDLYDSIGDKDEFLTDSFTQNFFATSKPKEESTPTTDSPITDLTPQNISSKTLTNNKATETSEKQNMNQRITNRNHHESARDEKIHSDFPDTRPHGNQPTTIILSKLPWWTTDAQLEQLLSELGYKWIDMRFDDNPGNGKIGTVAIEFVSASVAAAAKESFNGRTINGSSCHASFDNHSSAGRFVPSRQSSNRREERQAQNSPYYRSSQSDRGTKDSNRSSSGQGSSSSRQQNKDSSSSRYRSSDREKERDRDRDRDRERKSKNSSSSSRHDPEPIYAPRIEKSSSRSHYSPSRDDKRESRSSRNESPPRSSRNSGRDSSRRESSSDHRRSTSDRDRGSDRRSGDERSRRSDRESKRRDRDYK